MRNDGHDWSALLDSNDIDARVRVASAESTPPWVLDELAKDRHPVVRETVASHPYTPISTIVSLLRSRRPSVALSALWNPSLPEEEFLSAVTSADFLQRTGVGVHAECSLERLLDMRRERCEGRARYVAEESAVDPEHPV